MILLNLGMIYAEKDNSKDLIVTEIPYKFCSKPVSQHPDKTNHPLTKDIPAFGNIPYEHIDIKTN